jgi:hypothetical protein
MNLTKYKISYTLLTILFAAPLLIITNDFWDGALVSYGFRIDDLSGIKISFFESGWFLQFYLYKAVYILSSFIGISEELIIKTLTILSVIGISLEVKRLSSYLFKISEDSSYIAAFFVLIFPAWFVLVSNVLVIHVLCIYFLLLGYRRVMSKRQYFVGILLILLSFQLASNFMFAIGLITSDFIIRRSRNDITNFSYLLLSALTIVIIFLLSKVLFVPDGEYSNYNQLQLNLSILKPFVGAIIYFGIFITVLVFIPSLYFINNFKQACKKDDFVNYVTIFLLIICAIFPYAALGKSPRFFDFYNWDYRQAFLLSIPIPILIAYLYSKLDKLISLPKNRKPLLLASFTAILFLAFLYTGYTYKFISEYHREAIVYSLKKIEQPPSGIIGFNLKNTKLKHLTKIRAYEYNTLLQKAYGRANWMVSDIRINNIKDIFELKKWQKIALSADVYKVKNASIFAHENCRTLIEIQQNRDVTLFDILIRNYENVYTFSIIKSEGKRCILMPS